MRFLKAVPYLFILSWFVATVALAQDVAIVQKRPIVPGLGLAQYEALAQYPVVLSNAEEPAEVAYPGYFSVAWDNDNLYLYAVFEQPEESLSVDLNEDEPEWWLGDTLELFIKPTPDAALIHFAVNPAGVKYANRDFLSGANYTVFSRVLPAQWQLELAIPLGDVLPQVTAGDSWQFKLGRGFVAEGEYSLWPVGRDFLAEDNFGSLEFVEVE